MDINYFKQFVVLAETKNFLDAAESLYISQSTLSKHIRHMEEELGCLLLDRTTRRVNLTSCGLIFLEHARAIAKEKELYETALKIAMSEQDCSLNIGSIPMMESYHITDVIYRFRNNNPSILLNLKEEDSTTLKKQLLNGQLDLAFIRDEGETSDLFETISFQEDSLTAVLPVTHPLAMADAIHLDQLKEEDFLFLPPDTMMYSLCYTKCLENGFVPRIAYTGKQAANILALVEKGLGVSLLMKKPLEPMVSSKISLVPITPSVKTYIRIYYDKRKKLDISAQHFINSVHS